MEPGSAPRLWRVWLDTGRYVLVPGADEKEARRALTRTQRRRALKVVPIEKRKEVTS